MINDKMQKAFNEQINAELYSSYIYLSMSAYCESANYKGFAEWFRLQAEEEKEHAYKLMNHMYDRGGKVKLKAIEEPPVDFKSLKEIFEMTLEHERKVTGLIHKLYKLALDEDDYPAQNLLKWFIDEQVEEEASAEDILNQINMVDARPGNLFYIDRHIVRTRESS
jgi:ferritin